MIYFCKQCLKSHKSGTEFYEQHKGFAFNSRNCGMTEEALVKIFRLDKIISNDALFKRLIK